MVLASLIIAGILVVMLGEAPDVTGRKIKVTVTFPEAPNVAEKTPVRRRGVIIGRVTDIEFDQKGGVRLTVQIDEDRRPFRNEVCQIMRSLMGDSEVNFIVPPGEELSAELVEDGAELEGRVLKSPIEVVSELQDNLAAAMGSVVKTSDAAGEMMASLRDMFKENEDRIKTIVDTAEANMNLINTTLRNIDEVLGKEQFRTDLRDAVNKMPGLLDETREMFDQMDQTMRTVEARLKEVEAFTRHLGERGPGMIAKLDEGANKLNGVMDQMLTFSQALNRPDGTLGLMIHDEELYRNLNAAVANIEQLTRQLRPIVDDARIFSDKIARHPELLGVRGAVQRNPGIKGVPSFRPLQ